MNQKRAQLLVLPVLAMMLFMSCEKDFDIELKSGRPLLVVEAYINNELPLYNYVLLSRSQDYYSPDFQNTPVTGASVSITEGELSPAHSYQWDRSTTVQLKETRLPQISDVPTPGLYFDTTLKTDPSHALRGKPGKYYLLEIKTNEGDYTAITAMLQPVRLDSLSSADHFIDVDEDTTEVRARLTLFYKDPDTIGNTQLYYWNHLNTSDNFGWGGLASNRFLPGTDDLTNGQNMKVTLGNSFGLKDSVDMYLISVERSVYNFWDSFNKARQNGGPFSTPVTLLTNVKGKDVTGCFSGFSISTRTIVVK